MIIGEIKKADKYPPLNLKKKVLSDDNEFLVPD
jgi:hypothetical protein